MQKDFITATPDSGGSGSTTVTAAASANQTESARSTSLSVAGGGMTRTVGASQAEGVVTWNYYFSVTPTSLSFVAGGETKAVTVTSYRKKVINGVETSTQENVSWGQRLVEQGSTKTRMVLQLLPRNYNCGYRFKYRNSKNFWKCSNSVIDWVGDITDPFQFLMLR